MVVCVCVHACRALLKVVLFLCVSAQERGGDVGLHAEHACRLRVSAVVRKALLLLRAARCALPTAQWYIGRLQRCRRNYRKVTETHELGPDALWNERQTPLSEI